MAKNNNKKFAIYELFVGVIKEQYPKKLYPNQIYKTLYQYFGQFLEIVSRSKKEMICLPITYHLFLPYGKFIKRYYVRNVQC